MIKAFKALFFIPLIAVPSCTKTLEYDFAGEESQLAVTAKIIGSDQIWAVVSKSTAPLENRSEFSKNAKISLWENEVFKDSLLLNDAPLSHNGNQYWKYTSNYSCIPGRNYQIKVGEDQYETVNGITEMPDPPVLTNLQFNGDLLSFDILDPPSIGDIYRIQFLDSDSAKGYMSTSDNTIELYEDFYEFDFLDGGRKYGGIAYLKDLFFNGTKKSILFHSHNYIAEGDSLAVRISKISDSQYQFQRSLDLHFNSSDFSSEPITIYSNMSNGKGVFGAENNLLFYLKP